MWRLLVALGFLLALAGLVIMALGVAIFVSSFGNALIAAGAVSLSGGIVLIAVAAVLREVKEVGQRLDRVLAAISRAGAPTVAAAPSAGLEPDLMLEQDEPEPAFAPEPAFEPEPAFAPEPAFEPEPEPEPVAPPKPAFPRARLDRPEPPPVAPAPVPEALRRGRVLGRTPEGETFASRLRQPAEPTVVAPAPVVSEPPRSPLPAQRPFTPPPVPVSPRRDEPMGEPTVLKSGIVGGMAYTLYSDGSIQAELPDGTLRFASLQELRDHVARSAQPR